MPGPHVTAWAAKSLAGEPVSVVRVRNLQAVTSTGRDAWGRVGKPQPLLVSAELSFRQQFSRASAEDRLGTDTVNYGSLSKAILKCLERARPRAPDPEVGLRSVLDDLWFALTGLVVGKCPHEPVVRETFWDSTDGVLLLDLSVLKSMSITLMLPKASLLGEGVSLTASSIFGLQGGGAVVDAYSTTLRLHRLRVPTLIGVNANERLAKQIVVATIELDKVYPRNDIYTFVEDLVVKTMDKSSYETLEALGSRLGSDILGSLPTLLKDADNTTTGDRQVRLTLEKPTAVPFADCPVVELLVRENDAR